jgi:hypothetical protein
MRNINVRSGSRSPPTQFFLRCCMYLHSELIVLEIRVAFLSRSSIIGFSYFLTTHKVLATIDLEERIND